jgi:hypothetical protein
MSFTLLFITERYQIYSRFVPLSEYFSDHAVVQHRQKHLVQVLRVRVNTVEYTGLVKRMECINLNINFITKCL